MMKLRNKHTGESGDLMGSERSCPYIGIGIDFHDGNPKAYYYNSLTELNEEWEDYKPAEPLIKDEKIRKAVRAWAEVNDEKDNIIFSRNCEYSDYCFYTNGGGDLTFSVGIDLKEGSYTIAELCGEEEE